MVRESEIFRQGRTMKRYFILEWDGVTGWVVMYLGMLNVSSWCPCKTYRYAG